MNIEFQKILIIQLVGLALCSANQNCSNNSCAPIETIHTFEMEAELDGTMIHLSWNFNSSETIYGFSSVILSPDNATLYQSPVLHSDERKMTMNYELTSSEDSICLQVMKNQTEVLAQKCEHVEVSDLKMVIGILAGTIFIIPCIIAMGFIIYKDYHVRKLERIADMIEEEQTNKLLYSQSIEESHDGSVSCDNMAELERSHGGQVTFDKTDHVNQAKKDYEAETTKQNGLSGEDNLGFVSEVPEDKIDKEKSQNGIGDDYTQTSKSEEVQTKVPIEDRKPMNDEIHKRAERGESNEVKTKVTIENRNSESEDTDMNKHYEMNKRESVTLKIDIDLARKMAEKDNEITEEYTCSVHL